MHHALRSKQQHYCGGSAHFRRHGGTRWTIAKKKARRKDVAHCMGELEEIVTVFEEINKMKETNPQLPWVFTH
jgi:hypothetical protein